ncbi:MAG TPA: YqhR family membrane protein [Chondromyces sp.]|nr:YqhR family membrane protein [Chondromyces sp.]
MSEEKKRLEQNQTEKPMSPLMLAAITGLAGGAIWSMVAYIAYMFRFTKIEPNVILEPFTVGNWKETWIGIVLSILAYSIVSVGVALLYYALLRKMKSLWSGIILGLVLLGIVLLVLNPIFPSIKPWRELGLNTLVTCACVYVLYGVFIGYSISYEEAQAEADKQKDVSH